MEKMDVQTFIFESLPHKRKNEKRTLEKRCGCRLSYGNLAPPKEVTTPDAESKRPL